MLINITIGTTPCAIEVNKDCFIPIIYGINKKEDSPNYGKPTEDRLGFFTGINSFGRCVTKLIQECNASSEEKLTMQQYASRIEASELQVLEQLKDWDKLKKAV